MGRVRIPIVQRLIEFLAVLAAIIGSSVVMFAVLAVFPTDLRADDAILVVAQGQHWRTDRFDSNGSVSPQQVQRGDCLSGDAVIPAGALLRTRDVGLLRCDGAVFSRVPVNALVTSFTFVQFDDGVTHSSFVIPPIHPLGPTDTALISPIVSDGDFVTSITALPSKATSVTVDILDASWKQIASETFDVAPPISQYVLKTKVAVGSLRVRTNSYGCVGCAPEPLYFFVAVSDPRGGNMRVMR
jgi:hypothetical protein